MLKMRPTPKQYIIMPPKKKSKPTSSVIAKEDNLTEEDENKEVEPETEEVDSGKLVYEGPRDFLNVVLLFKPGEECPSLDEMDKEIDKLAMNKGDIIIHCLTGGNRKKEGQYPVEVIRMITGNIRKKYVFHGWYVEQAEQGEDESYEDYLIKQRKEESKTLKRMFDLLEISDTSKVVWKSKGMLKEINEC